jgi:hypothetical protein
MLSSPQPPSSLLHCKVVKFDPGTVQPVASRYTDWATRRTWHGIDWYTGTNVFEKHRCVTQGRFSWTVLKIEIKSTAETLLPTYRINMASCSESLEYLTTHKLCHSCKRNFYNSNIWGISWWTWNKN